MRLYGSLGESVTSLTCVFAWFLHDRACEQVAGPVQEIGGTHGKETHWQGNGHR